MSVLMTLRVHGDAAELERRAGANPAAMQGLRDRAVTHGLIAHRFFANDQGEILVVDEWETEAGFRSFFAESTEIPGLMAEIGVREEPEIRFWRKLETHDDYPVAG
jgi:heme-degrading monooxygenase HmoA